MRNIKLEIEYDGTDYSGWQTQRKCKTIQGTIEKALQKILQEKVRLIGSGRTDAGVHAQAQIANFKTNSKIPARNIQLALNALLPEDIVILKAKDAPLDFHARYNAKCKTYRYTILNREYPSALLRNHTYLYPYKLNLNLMRKEAESLLGKHDFRAFQTLDKKRRNPIRIIKSIKIKKKGPLIDIYITANGFLYNMVRRIVGALLEIGRGKFPLSHPNVPAKGLTLIKVSY